MTLEEIKKEIKKLIDKCNNDIYKYDDLHVNAQRSYTRSSAYKNYVESKGKRAGLQEALHIIEQLEDYDILFSKYCELKRENELLEKNNVELLKEFKVTDLSKEEIVDLLSTALYGSPWWKVDNSTEEYKQADGDTIEEKLADMLLKDQSVYLIDMEEDTPYELTLDKLCKGIGLFIKNGGSTDIDDYDLVDADSVLQYAIFDEIIWG